jgi:hypothetical protein
VGLGCWDEGEIRKMMNAGEINTKEIILMTRATCSVLKEEIEDDECG